MRYRELTMATKTASGELSKVLQPLFQSIDFDKIKMDFSEDILYHFNSDAQTFVF